jgi:hypothetical protein
MDDAALDAAIAKASDELGLQVWYREIVRPLVRMEPERWPQCCGGACEPCTQLLVSVARRAREILGTT